MNGFYAATAHPDLRRVIDAAGTMIIGCRPDGTVNLFNAAAERMLHWSADDVLGQHTPLLWHDAEELKQRAAELSAVLNRPVEADFSVFVAGLEVQEHDQREWTFIRRDGSRVPAMLVVSAVKDDAGSIVGYLGTAQDLTERMQLNAELEQRVAERTAALARSEQRLRHGNRILELLATEASLKQILMEMVDTVQDQCPGVSFFIQLSDESERQQKQEQPECRSQPVLSADGELLGNVTAEVHPEAHRHAVSSDEITDALQWAARFASMAIERTRSRSALAASERFSRAVLNSLSANIAVVDHHGRIVMTNQSWKNYAAAHAGTDATHTVSEGVNYLDACDRAAAAGDRDAVAAAGAIRCLIEGDKEQWHYEYECTAAGAEGWFCCRATRFPAPAVVTAAGQGGFYAVVAHEDITPMKKAQDDLASSLDRLQSLSRASPVGILLFDAHGGCADVNRCWTEMTGLSLRECEADGWQTAIHPGDRQSVVQRWKEAVISQQSSFSEFRLQHVNGHSIWVVCHTDGIVTARGQLTGHVCTVTNVSQQKHTEQALRLQSALMTTLSGSAFYQGVVTGLAELLDMEIVVIGRRNPQQPEQFLTVAWTMDGSLQPEFSYQAEGTPCGEVAVAGWLTIPSNVQAEFPEDEFLRDAGIQSYAGVLLACSNSHPIGHLSVLSRQQLYQADEVESVLKLFAVSVSAEMERQQLTRRYSDLFQFSTDAIVITDRDGRIVQSNRQVEQVFGWKGEDLVGQPIEVLIPENVRDRHVSLRRQYAESASPRAMGDGRTELQGLRRNGQVFPVDVSLIPMENEDGVLFAAVARDISRQQLTVQALRDAKAFSETIIESVSGLFYVIDEDGYYVRWNRAMQELFGLADYEMKMTRALTTIHPEDRPMIAERMADVFRDGHATAEARLLTRNRVIHTVLNGRRMDVDGRPYIVGSGIDVTEKYEMHEMLRRSEARYRELFEGSQDALMTVSPETYHFASANAATLRMFGCADVRQFCRLGPWDISPERQPDGSPSAEKAKRMIEIATWKGSHSFDWTHCRLDGSEFFATVLLTRLEIDGIPQLQATVRDVSEERRILQELVTTADQLRMANAVIEQDRENLAMRVAERTAELTAANAELTKASRAKSEFLATMSHELRTPLNGVLGMNELLLATELNIRQRQFVEASSSCGRLLMQLVNDVLDLSKIEAGRLELDPTECNIESIVYDTIEMLSFSARQKNISLWCQFAPDACVVAACDDSRLRQVLVNLVANAIKFTNEGSVTVRVERRSIDGDLARLRFSVRDTGIGISPEQRTRLFAAFTQGDSSTTRRYGGTGLGLSICRQLVVLMGGEIDVDTQLNVGSTFWFEIPVHVTRETLATLEILRKMKQMVVFAVDSLLGKRRHIKECLTYWGSLHRGAASVSETLDVVLAAAKSASQHIVILIDHRFLTGNDLARMRNITSLSKVHLIVLATPLDDVDPGTLTELEVRRILRDPVRPSDLLEAMCDIFTEDPHAGPAESPEKGQQRANPDAIGGHILVAEDNRVNQLYLVELLKHFGCTADVAKNGVEVLNALAQHQYHLILMDCQMPEMDGLEATREIRRREQQAPDAPRIPVIALTANALKGDRELCLDAGMDEYLSKPLESHQLRAVLERFLGMQMNDDDAAH